MVQKSRWYRSAIFLALFCFAPCSNNFAGQLQPQSTRRSDKLALLKPLKHEVPRLSRAASIDLAEYMDDFYKVAMDDASSMGKDTDVHLNEILERANNFILGDELWDRSEFEESLVSAITDRGLFTLVLGGKSVGKSFVKDKVIRRIREENPDIEVIDVDMRDAFLHGAGTANFGIVMPGLLEMVRNEALYVATGKYPAHQVDKWPGIQASVTRILQEGKVPALVIDEAHLALPEQKEPGEDLDMKRALSYFVGITRAGDAGPHFGSVVMISSKYSFLYRLSAIHFDISRIDGVIFATEVPEKDMLRLLQERWGMGENLAKTFYKYFSGHIRKCYNALRVLVEEKRTFDPFSVFLPGDIQRCIEDSCAFKHLKNIASQGYSFVLDPDDVGARFIEEAGVGGVISRFGRFGLPREAWKTTKCDHAVIPSSFYMRLEICRALQRRSPVSRIR